MPSRTASENSSMVNVDAIFLCSTSGCEHRKRCNVRTNPPILSHRLTSINSAWIRATALSCMVCDSLCKEGVRLRHNAYVVQPTLRLQKRRMSAGLDQSCDKYSFCEGCSPLLRSIYWALSFWTVYSSAELINRKYVVNPKESLPQKLYHLSSQTIV